MISSALLSGLLPNTRYYYVVGSNASGFGWSSEYSFLTAPADDTVRLLAWADHGAYNPDNSSRVPGSGSRSRGLVGQVTSLGRSQQAVQKPALIWHKLRAHPFRSSSPCHS